MDDTLPFLIPSFCFTESEGDTVTDTFEGPVYHYCSRYQILFFFFSFKPTASVTPGILECLRLSWFNNIVIFWFRLRKAQRKK